MAKAVRTSTASESSSTGPQARSERASDAASRAAAAELLRVVVVPGTRSIPQTASFPIRGVGRRAWCLAAPRSGMRRPRRAAAGVRAGASGSGPLDPAPIRAARSVPRERFGSERQHEQYTDQRESPQEMTAMGTR